MKLSEKTFKEVELNDFTKKYNLSKEEINKLLYVNPEEKEEETEEEETEEEETEEETEEEETKEVETEEVEEVEAVERNLRNEEDYKHYHKTVNKSIIIVNIIIILLLVLLLFFKNYKF